MTGDSTTDVLDEYVALLREFGLPDGDIRDLHADDEAPDDAPLREFVARRVDASSREALFSRLVETLTQSRRGVSATASYWNYAPEVHLDEAFEPYGCSVTFRDAAHGGGGASVEIELEDASGSSHRMRFEYPDTPLGDDNLPALLDAVENELLASTDLTFVLLTPIDRRWRVVLIESDRLAELEPRRGDRVEFAGRPLVREDQPPAFARGETAEVFPTTGETRAGTDRPTASEIANDRAADADELLAGDGGSGLLVDEPSDPEAVLDAAPDDGFPERTPPTGAMGSGVRKTTSSSSAAHQNASRSEDVEASDQELKRVFGDLSDVSLEPTASADAALDVRADDPPVLELGTGGEADGASADAGPDGASTGAADDDPDDLDGLFEELERTAITGDAAVRTSGAGGAMVVGGAESGPAARDVDRPRDRDADASDDRSERRAESPRRSDAGGLDDIDDRAVDELLAGIEAEVSVADDGDSEAVSENEKESPGEFRWLSDSELAERN